MTTQRNPKHSEQNILLLALCFSHLLDAEEESISASGTYRSPSSLEVPP